MLVRFFYIFVKPEFRLDSIVYIFESGLSSMMAGLLSEDKVQVCTVLHRLAMRMGGEQPILVWSVLWIRITLVWTITLMGIWILIFI
jgi:hypothetical protein